MRKFITGLLVITMVGISSVMTYAQNSAALYQEGMLKAEGEGNLEEAIQIYTKVVNDESAERSLRAKALMQVGICYERLGKENAHASYQKLVNEFSDQQEIASMARRKLKQLTAIERSSQYSGIGIQQIKKGLNLTFMLRGISPDGSSFLYVDQVNNEDEIVKYDINSGETFKLTNNNTSAYGAKNSSFPWRATWSANGEHIAYNRSINSIEGQKVDLEEIRIMDKDGKNDKVIISGPKKEIPGILSFTPDGKNILAVMGQKGDADNPRKLVLLSLGTKELEIIKEINDSYTGRITYSPDGKYTLFAKIDKNQNQDVYLMNMSTLEEHQVTHDGHKDWDPVWSPEGDQILFLSDRLGSTDAYKINFKDGKVSGKPENIKSGLGDNITVMGVDANGAVYFSAQNERFDIYTLNIEDLYNNKQAELELITNPNSKKGGYAPQYSQNGRYISFLNNIRFRDQAPGEDAYLGEKYLINIYDTQTKKTKLLNNNLYLGIYTRELPWRMPTWSFDNSKLLVYGTVKDTYQGGFYSIDINSEEVSPIYTKPGHKKGTNYKRLGNMGTYSQNDQDIYYTSFDFKELLKYNIASNEEKSIASNKDGFWFEGFWDKEETKIVAQNRFGLFSHDIISNKITKIRDREDGGFVGITSDKKYYFLIKNNTTLLKVSTDGGESEKSISIENFLENMIIQGFDLRSDGKQIVLNVIKTTGQEVNKLTHVFD